MFSGHHATLRRGTPMTSRWARPTATSTRRKTSSPKLLRHQDAWLELQDAWVERGENSPDAVLIEILHDRFCAFGIIEFQPHDHAVLADADEEVGIEGTDIVETRADEIGDIGDHGGDFGPLGDFQDLERDDTAEFGPACGRHMRKTVLLQPLARAFVHDAAGNGIEAPGDALADHHDIRGHAHTS